ncbi:f-box only protein [Anaeramoeba ignava]|uniref:F-box only protein n=1 Tax=Anaeramoeba ignava TaxID=1746090 RepID=A0A9Q0RD96_ANAIG|nr:f-box only protein [Anaeramoeba ignava]
MQNQIEIEEKEIEKEIEEEKLKSVNYHLIGKESFIPINKKDFQKLKKSELISTPFKTKKPSNEINLIFEMLFDEILLIILSYLSPGEIIIFSLTCKQAQTICSDYLLWKQIAIKFQDYFKWNSIRYDYYNNYYYNYPNIDLKAIQFKIQEKNQNNPNQKQIEELSKTNEKIKNYFDNSNSSTIQTGTYNYKQNFISIKSERLIYIQNLKNPKQKIEKKAKMIYKEMKKAKKGFIQYQKQQNRINYNYNYNYNYNPNYNYYTYGSRKYLLNEVIITMNGIILISTLIILNYFIDSKKPISIPKLFLLSEIDLIITIFWVIYSKSNFYSLQEYFNFLSIIISGFILLILISLKTTIIFNFIPWLIVLLPSIILFIHFISQLNQQIKIYPYEKLLYSSFISSLIYLIIVLLFTGLKIDGFIEIKYLKLIYLLIIFEIYILYSIKKELRNFCDFIGFLIFFVSVSISFLILFLYGDGIIKKLWISLIPFYIILAYLYFFSFIIFFTSGFKFIFN